MLPRNRIRFITLACLIHCALLLSSCESEYTPKPRGYFRIQLPPKNYTVYNSTEPYSFEYPEYAVVSKDTDRNTEPFWINIHFPKFKGQLHVSYKRISGNLSKYIEDSRSLAYKHTIKANSIDEMAVETANGLTGIVYAIDGNTASSTQFYLTDENKHFLRASLYFNVPPKSDSLAPVVEFIEADVMRMVNSLKFK